MLLQPKSEELYIYEGEIKSNKIASFDLDWTLVGSNNKFPRNQDDWTFLRNRIATLKKYQNDYTLVIFTNQGYKGERLNMALNRINNILKYLIENNIKPWVFVATGKDSSYRKPNIKMWEELSKYIKDIDNSKSFYTGDAAGRLNDFDDIDIKFAKNVKIKFYTPEEIF
ncbi:MAG: DNA 3'-phosphatase [Nitrososphaerota archaeon]